MPRGKAIDAGWLAEHYPVMTTVEQLLDDHEAEFGWRPTKTSMYMRANHLGIRKAPVSGRGERAERTIRWSREPEMSAWMLEHDHGQRMDELQREWRERWGFGIAHGQINIFRASHGTSRPHHEGAGRPPVPVGTERASKDGYIVVKVADRAGVPMSKDNWMLKHVWAFEQAYGPVPDGCSVYFADGDIRNFDPSNLVAVPKRLAGTLNGPGMPRWYDRESLLACVALAEIKVKAKEVEMSAPRTCAVCGRAFVPDERQRKQPSPPKTCRECLDKGRKAKGDRTYRRRYDHDEIRRLHAMGLNRREIAERVGCAQPTVSYVLRGDCRKRASEQA